LKLVAIVYCVPEFGNYGAATPVAALPSLDGTKFTKLRL
jgi:hypothetical protein